MTLTCLIRVGEALYECDLLGAASNAYNLSGVRSTAHYATIDACDDANFSQMRSYKHATLRLKLHSGLPSTQVQCKAAPLLLMRCPAVCAALTDTKTAVATRQAVQH